MLYVVVFKCWSQERGEVNMLFSTNVALFPSIILTMRIVFRRKRGQLTNEAWIVLGHQKKEDDDNRNIDGDEENDETDRNDDNGVFEKIRSRNYALFLTNNNWSHGIIENGKPT